MRRRSAVLAGLLAAVAASLLLPAIASASSWQQAAEVAVPSGAGQSWLNGVACPAVGSCVAVGGTWNGSEELAIVATEAGGAWDKAVDILPPSGTEDAWLNGVACPAVGSCVAVGGTWNGSEELAIVATEAGGAWGQAIEVAAPNGAEEARLDSVACPAAGSCVAVGSYADSVATHAMVVTETAGAWDPAVEVATPSGAEKARLESVACPAAGSCAAVGFSKARSKAHAMTASETAAAWGPGVEVAAPSGAEEARLESIACPAAGPCAAAGFSKTGSTAHAMTASETGGAWGPGVEVAAPSGEEEARLAGVACPAVGYCAAVGDYSEGSKAHAMTASEAAGAWGPGVEVAAPSGAEEARLESVACPAAGSCAAVGTYTSGSEEHAMAVNGEISVPSTQPPPAHQPTRTPPTCSVSLGGSTVAVKAGKAQVKLTDKGNAACVGKLSLKVKVKSKKGKRAKAKTIGSASFRLAAGKAATIRVKLNAAGRSALNAHRGRLSATLSVTVASKSTTKRVHLVQRRKKAKKKR